MRVLMAVGVVAVAYVLVMTFGGCADRLILPPRLDPPAVEGTSRRMIAWRGADEIEVFTARSRAAATATAPGEARADPRAFVLRFTGGDASGAAAFTASRWEGRHVEVWVANYPGYGRSSGPRTLKAMSDAALRTFDELKRLARDRAIFVEGYSLGTVPALHVAGERPVSGVIIQNPPPLRQLILGAHGWWNLWLLAGPVAAAVPREFDSVANARRATAPAVFLLAEKDETIPLKFQRMVFDDYAGPKRLILQRGAKHFEPLSNADEAQLESGIDWLMEAPR
jgi:hypothetical protein